MDLSVFFLFCFRRVQFSPSVLWPWGHELNSQLITVDLNEELVCGKVERSQRTLKQTSQGDSSYTGEPQQQTCASGSRAFRTNTTTNAYDSISPVSLIDLSENRVYVCVVTWHEKESGRENRDRGRKGGRKGKRMKKRLYWAERAALQGSSCCVLIRAGCENKSL